MKHKVYKQGKRDKAFLGAIIGPAIGAVAGIAGSLISGKKKAKADEEALAQQQADQTRTEGIQQAAAMTSTYANQDYVDQYLNKITLKGGGKVKLSQNLNKNLNKNLNGNLNGKVGKSLNKNLNNDRIGMTKKFAMGGRKKALFGLDDALVGSVIGAVGQGVSGAIDKSYNNNSQVNIPGATTAIANITANNKAAASADARKLIKPLPSAIGTKALDLTPTINTTLDVQPINTNLYKNGGKKKYKLGGGYKPMNTEDDRPKAGFGSFLSGALGAVSGVSSLIGAFAKKSDAPKTLVKSDGFSSAAPKTGLVQNSYQVDANGVPIQNVNDPTQVVDPTTGVAPVYTDRIAQAAKMGTKVRKAVGKSNAKY